MNEELSTCTICGDSVTAPDADALYAALLTHELNNHPDSARLSRVIDGTVFDVPCLDCGETFRDEAKIEHGKISVKGYCPECVEVGYLREIVCKGLDPSYAIANEHSTPEGRIT